MFLFCCAFTTRGNNSSQKAPIISFFWPKSRIWFAWIFSLLHKNFEGCHIILNKKFSKISKLIQKLSSDLKLALNLLNGVCLEPPLSVKIIISTLCSQWTLNQSSKNLICNPLDEIHINGVFMNYFQLLHKFIW